MDKTVTASFESVDLATFAAKNVTDHFDTVKKVKVTYDKPSVQAEGDPFGFPGYFMPYGPSNTAGMPSGIGLDGTTGAGLPIALAMANRERERDGDEISSRKAKVSITAPENILRQIESTLHAGGGLGIQVS